jgi:hypothetical protein
MKIAMFLNVRICGAVEPAVFLLGLFFDPDDRGNMLLRNIGKLQSDSMASTSQDIVLFLNYYYFDKQLLPISCYFPACLIL